MSPETLILLLSSGLFLKPKEDEFVYFFILLLISSKHFRFPSQKQNFTLPIKF